MTAIIIFLISYLFIAGKPPRFFPIGRPTGALLGAFLMIACGVVPFTTALSPMVIDWNTILLLLGAMIQSSLLAQVGFYRYLVAKVAARTPTPRRLLAYTMLVSGALSALLVNDTVCVLLTPLVVSLARTIEVPLLPLLLAVAIGANIGSALTLSGNPQNAIIGSVSGIPYVKFMLAMALPVAVSLIGAYFLLLWFFRHELRLASAVQAEPATTELDRTGLIKSLIGLGVTVGGYLLGYPIAGAAIAGALVALILHRRDPRPVFHMVDWPLLIFFASLFIIMHGLAVQPWVHEITKSLGLLFSGGLRFWHLTWITLIGSQVFSNVPFVLIARGWVGHFVGQETMFWYILAYVSTIAGCLTIVGSVANIIVVENMGDDAPKFGFFKFLRYGVPITLLSTGLGVAILLAEGSFIH